MIRQFGLAIGILCVLLSSSRIVYSQEEKAKKFVSVCQTTQVADFTRQVVGDRWEVFSILGEGADPHTHEVSTADTAMVSKADLCLQNGWNLEHGNWMGVLAKNANKPIVTCVDGIKKFRTVSDSGKPVKDPHAWFSPINATVYVRNVLRGVSQIDPENAAEYRARAELYVSQLGALKSWIDRQVNSIPANKRVLITNHDAFGYFCDLYKFKSFAPTGWSTNEVGGGTSTSRRKEVIDSIRKFGVRTIFVESTIDKEREMKQIAKEAGVELGPAIYSDAMGGAGSAGETYIGMMRENVLTIVKGLK